jgi:hypothetical protein
VGGLFTRRAFVKRSALLAGATAGSGLLAGPAHARRARNDLSVPRERTYRALVAAVAAGTADAAYVDRTTAEFRRWYRSSLPHVRASVDATIDSLRQRRGRVELSELPAPTAARAVALARLPLTPADDLRRAPGAV